MELASLESIDVSFQIDKSTEISYNRNTIIGWGAYSFNFRGTLTSKKITKDIAIKEIRLNSLAAPCEQFSLKAAQTEISILKGLKHKNVIKFLGDYKNDERIMIIQKFCNQGDLANFLTKNQFMSQDSVLNIFYQMILGFKYLLNKKIFHGDIKPENILLHNNKAKIADFGMSSKFKNSNDIFTEVIGSPGYMSPEIMSGQSYTIESDIWALGVTLYYMIYEQTPWGDLKNPVKLNKILKEKRENKETLVNFPENWRFPVSEELKNLIRKMIVYEVKERISWSELFTHKTVCDVMKKQKKGPLPVLWTKKNEKQIINSANENFCSPLLLIDEGDKAINTIKISQFTINSLLCKTGNN